MAEGAGVRLEPGHLVDNRWEVIGEIGHGAFGTVYEAKDIKGEIEGCKALKVESLLSQDQVLKIEVAVLSDLYNGQHVCKLYAYGKNDRFNFMLMSLLGPTLTHLKKKLTGHCFSVPTTMTVIYQCIEGLSDLHAAGWLHRDVKPSNFAMGHPSLDVRRTVFILDFGLSRMYRRKNGKMREPRTGTRVGFRGTLRYCPLNAHRGIDLGRQDDLISLIFMTIEMLNSTLPWKTLDKADDVQASKEAQVHKLTTAVSPAFHDAYVYLDKLKYDHEPDYAMLHSAVCSLCSKETMNTTTFDWNCPQRLLPEKKQAHLSPLNKKSKAINFDNIVPM